MLKYEYGQLDRLMEVTLDKTAEHLNIFGLFHANFVTFEFDQYLQMNGTPKYSKQFSYVFNANAHPKIILADVGNVVKKNAHVYYTPNINKHKFH